MSQQTAIVTGAGGAIAGYVIDTLRQAGWKLALVAHSDESRTNMTDTYPDTCVVQADLADDTAAKRAIDSAHYELGSVDALFNIAGGFDMSGVVETTPEQMETQLTVNLRTAFNATRAVLPHMLEAGHGFVLGVGAGQAINGAASTGPYAAAKAGLIAWLKSMHAELASKGIEMGIVYPMGAVDTPDNRAAMPDVDPAGFIDPQEIADTTLHMATRGSRGRIREAKIYPTG